MVKKVEIAKDGKMDRLKANWKKLALAILGLGGVVYFILTGEEIDWSNLVPFLQ